MIRALIKSTDLNSGEHLSADGAFPVVVTQREQRNGRSDQEEPEEHVNFGKRPSPPTAFFTGLRGIIGSDHCARVEVRF